VTSPSSLPYRGAAAAARGDGLVDYTVVRRLRQAVAERLSAELVALRKRRSADVGPADRRMLGRALIDEQIANLAASAARDGRAAPTPEQEDALAGAVFAAIFGLGRLERWVHTAEIENIDVNGCDQVWLSYAGGRREKAPPVADSDDELVEMIQSFAAYLGQSTREFSSAKPLLNLRLPDGSRLSAWMSVSPRPGLTIRRHRYTDIDLDDLIGLGTVDRALAEFLRAAVRARRNIVVTGAVNAGKTTLVRALANEFDPADKLVICEQEYELGLDRLPGRHRQVISLEARDANAEGSGAVGLPDLVVHALRMNPDRIIVGEVRSDELLPMLRAMGSGCTGSLCTLHANSAAAAFGRMAAIGLASPQRLPVEATHLLAADAVHLIVHLDLVDDTGVGGVRQRRVAGVLEVTGVGENGRVATNEVFRPGPDGGAVPGCSPASLPLLVRAGFDPGWLQRPAAQWPPPTADRDGQAFLRAGSRS